jgi:cytoskeletal protein RodZ
MTKVIAIAVVLLVLYGSWHFFLYWEQVKNDEEAQKEATAAAVVHPQALEGMPMQLESSLEAAQSQGAAALRNWLKTYGSAIQDPRKAWIELDYCVLLFRENPAEAKRIFAEVKERTSPTSPVWPRIKQLQPTYE